MIAAVLLCALLSTTLHAQFEVYRTVDDLFNKTPQTYPGFDFDSQKGMTKDSKIELKNGATKEKVEIDCSTIWGFSYKGHLFRIIRYGKYYNSTNAPQNMPAELVQNKDGIFHWLNARSLLAYAKGAAKRMAQGKDPGPFFFDPHIYQGFLSTTVDGDMMVVLGKRFLDTPDWVGVGEEEFMKDNPQLQWLKDCVMNKSWKFYGQHYNDSMVTDCIDEHVAPAE